MKTNDAGNCTRGGIDGDRSFPLLHILWYINILSILILSLFLYNLFTNSLRHLSYIDFNNKNIAMYAYVSKI